MSKRVSILIIAITCTCIGAGIGYLTGAARSGIMIKNYLLDSNSSWLTQHIVRLAMIRNGHADECAANIEMFLDNSVVQLSMDGLDMKGSFNPLGFNSPPLAAHGFSQGILIPRPLAAGIFIPRRLPENHLRALQVAKVYADAGYRTAFSKESLHILDQVEPIDGKYCAAVLLELQEQASK